MRISPLLPALLLTGAIALPASHARADVLINDFESGTYYGGVDGWFSYGGNAANYPQKVSNPTGGSSTWLALQPANQYYGQAVAQSWAVPNVALSDIVNNNLLSFDLIVDPSWLTPNFSQTISFELDQGSNKTTYNMPLSLPNVATSTAIHVALPYAIPAGTTADSWNLLINGSPGYQWAWDPANPSVIPFAGTFYIDNLTLSTAAATPEPATLSLASLALIPTLLRRRK